MSIKEFLNFSRQPLALIKNILLLILLTAFPAIAEAQQCWSLDDCIRHSYANNLALRQEELLVKLKANQLRQTKLDALPSLNARASHTNRFGRSVDPLTYEFTTDNSQGASLAAYSDITLFEGWQGINRIRKSKIDLDISLAKFEQARNDLAIIITRHFMEILFYREVHEVINGQISMVREEEQSMEKLIEAGALPINNRLEMKAKIAAMELERMDADNQFQMARLNLCQLLEIDDPTDFCLLSIEAEIDDLPLLIPDPAHIYLESVVKMPAIKAAELGIKGAQKNLQMVKGQLSPVLNLSAGWGTGYSNQIRETLSGNSMPLREQLGFANTTFFSFELDIPVFNQLSVRNRIKTAEIGVEQKELELQSQKRTLFKEIQLAAADARAAGKKLEASRYSVTTLEKAFESAKQRFQLGMITALEYNSALTTLAQARSEEAQAKYSYLFNVKILNFYRELFNDQNNTY